MLLRIVINETTDVCIAEFAVILRKHQRDMPHLINRAGRDAVTNASVGIHGHKLLPGFEASEAVLAGPIKLAGVAIHDPIVLPAENFVERGARLMSRNSRHSVSSEGDGCPSISSGPTGVNREMTSSPKPHPRPELPGRVRAGLLGSKLLLVCRGWPGLGRVIQSYCLFELVRALRPTSQGEFYSSGPGLAWLEEQEVLVKDLPTVPQQLSTMSYLLQAPAVRLFQSIQKDPPSAIVVDGEPLIVPVLRTFYQGPIVAMLNPAEVIGRDEARAAAFLTFVETADAIICSALDAAPGCTRWPHAKVPAFELAPLVRHEFLAAKGAQTSGTRRRANPPRVVVVLGGGSMNDRAMQFATAEIASGIVAAAHALENVQFSVFSLDPSIQEMLGTRPRNIELHSSDRCAKDICEAAVVVARAGRNTTAEILAVGVPTILIPSDTRNLRGREQRRNAELASNIAETCLLLEPDELAHLAATIARLLEHGRDAPSEWLPGNSAMSLLLRGATADQASARC